MNGLIIYLTSWALSLEFVNIWIIEYFAVSETAPDMEAGTSTVHLNVVFERFLLNRILVVSPLQIVSYCGSGYALGITKYSTVTIDKQLSMFP